MPLGIGSLTSLQTLSKVIIGEDDKFKISDLKRLLNIQGQLSIERLHKVRNAVEAKEVNLHQKKGIYNLRLEWSDVFDGSWNEITEYEVLDGLRPFEKLRSLSIVCYMGKQFPSWVGDPSFVCLTQLTLRGCKSCKYLQALGHLPSLQKLFVGGIDGLERLGFEFLGHFNSCHVVAFPSLEVLRFEDMKNWVEWSTSGGNIAGVFPCLHEMYMINCGKLNVVSLELTTLSLQVLHVERCSLVMLRNMICMCSSIARLKMNNIKGLVELDGESLKLLKNVEHLSISECDELRYMWESEAATCNILLNLQKLEVEKCKSLISLGEKVMQSVTEVKIHSCNKLESYNCPSSVEKLKINVCDSLTSLCFPDDLPSTLKFLNIMLFPEGCLVHLTRLEIYGCNNIESIPGNGYGFLPSRCLRRLVISNCKNLKSFPHGHLQSLASLVEIQICKCPNLDYSFPCGLWPPNLNKLELGELKKPILEWGMQNFPTSLVSLILHGDEDPGVVTFAKAKEEDTSSSLSSSSSSSFLLPSSLTSLHLYDFKELESLLEGV
ncbi:hypothetical protein R6Q57_003317 [Mikania cordata]